MYRVFPAHPGLAGAIAELQNRVYRASGIACHQAASRADELERLLSGGSRWRVGAASTGRGLLLGVSWVRPSEGRLWAYILVDPLLPRPIALSVYRALARWSLEEAHGPLGGPVLLGLGVYYGPLHWLASEALGFSPGEAVREYTLMESSVTVAREPRAPSGFMVSLLEAPPSGRLLEEAVWVINDAFSVYPDHEDLEPEEARRWLGELFRLRPGSFIAVASRGGRVCGVAVAYPVETVCGERKVYLSTLAVARPCQGRGLGRLLVEAVKWRSHLLGARGVVLDSEPAAEGLYYRLGFTPVAWWARALVPHTLLDA